MILMRALCSYFRSGYLFAGTSAISQNNFFGSLLPVFNGGGTLRWAVARTALLGIVVATIAVATVANAASINYGTFNIPAAGIMFQDVIESSGTDPVPMYGPPDPFIVGLDFDPTSFVASSAGGGADITDGQLNFTVMGLANANGKVGIDGIGLFEAGDYTLAGVGGVATSVFAGAIMRATVTQIDGVAIAPISLLPVNGSVSFSLPGTSIVSPWSLGLFLDIASQLQSLGYTSGEEATKVEVAINNSLVSTSELSTVSLIAKKEFRIDLVPDLVGEPFVPEPSTLALAALALCGLQIAGGGRRG